MKEEEELNDNQIQEIVFDEDQRKLQEYEQRVEYTWQQTTNTVTNELMQ